MRLGRDTHHEADRPGRQGGQGWRRRVGRRRRRAGAVVRLHRHRFHRRDRQGVELRQVVQPDGRQDAQRALAGRHIGRAQLGRVHRGVQRAGRLADAMEYHHRREDQDVLHWPRRTVDDRLFAGRQLHHIGQSLRQDQPVWRGDRKTGTDIRHQRYWSLIYRVRDLLIVVIPVV